MTRSNLCVAILFVFTIQAGCDKSEPVVNSFTIAKLQQGTKIAAYLGGGSQDISLVEPSVFNEQCGKKHYAFARFWDMGNRRFSTDAADQARLREWLKSLMNVDAKPILFLHPSSDEYFHALSNSSTFRNSEDREALRYFADFINNNTDKGEVYIVFGEGMNLPKQIDRSWGQQANDYITAYINTASVFKSVNSTKFKMCWVPNPAYGYPWGGIKDTNKNNSYLSYYPDKDVDFVGLPIFPPRHGLLDSTDSYLVDHVHRSLDGYPDFYEQFVVGKGKPMFVSITSFWDETIANDNSLLEAYKTKWITQLYNELTWRNKLNDKINFIIWFHVRKLEQSWTNNKYYDKDFRIPLDNQVYQNIIRRSYF